MIKIDKGHSEINGDSTLLINEIAIGIMVICEAVGEKVSSTEEEILGHIMQALQGQKLAKSGMSIDDVESVMGVSIDRERTEEANKGME